MAKIIGTESSDDPVMENFLQRLPKDVVDSFSAEQLEHIHSALGVRSWKKHSIDIRTTFPIPFVKRRIYLVLLMGRNRRELSRKEVQISAFTMAAFISAFILFSILLGLLVLYLIKSALGIDLFEGFSLGIWDWFKSLFSN